MNGESKEQELEIRNWKPEARPSVVGITDPASPSVSVCIPAYKRPLLLRRAIASVFAQTYKDWELLISDDEDPPGETWDYLQQLPERDSRVRVMRNPGPHGQVPNINSTFRQARGTWIKPLHHDDVLRPECLETLLLSTRGLPSVVMVSGLVQVYFLGRRVRSCRRRGKAPVELIRQPYVHLGMYLQDCTVGLPTQVMVQRNAIEHGALFEDVPGIISSVDAVWNCAVLRQGDLLLVNKVLAEHHQDHKTITGSLRVGQLEAEYPIVLRKELECIDPSLKPPPLPVVLQMAKFLRAFSYLKDGKIHDALWLVRQVWHPAAWLFTTRWVLSQIFPGSFHVAPRIPVTRIAG
jgi:glycosyltransferase involved in cell wall biosynthesis